MEIKIYKQITEIKDIWIRLINSNHNLSVFQTYEWNKGLEDKFFSLSQRLVNKIRENWSLSYHVLKFSEDIVVIPLIISEKNKTIAIFGQQDMSDYLSFVFDENIPFQYIVESVHYLKNKYSEYKILLDRINVSNEKMLEALKTFDISPVEKKCVKIPIVKDLIANVKSDSRRYAKQGYNRLRENNLDFEVKIIKKKINTEESKNLHQYFKSRYYNKFKYNFVKKIYSGAKDYLYEILGTDNTLYYYFKYNEVIFMYELYIDGKMAAYMVGVELNDIMSILRISIDDELFNYRPGIILILESIEYLNSNNKNIRFIDFSRGDESYKMNYGGIIHNNFSFTLKP